MTELWTLENEIYDSGVEILCGVDEAGRGPLAGDVVAACVIRCAQRLSYFRAALR